MSLPSPHTIGLQSHGSALPGSQLLGMCQVPAPHWIHAPPGSLPIGLCQTPSQHWINTPSGSLPSRLCQTPLQHWINKPPGSMPQLCATSMPLQNLCSLSPLSHRPCGAPALPDTTGTTPLQDPQPRGIPAPWLSTLWNYQS
jgi:hypothetical protein